MRADIVSNINLRSVCVMPIAIMNIEHDTRLNGQTMNRRTMESSIKMHSIAGGIAERRHVINMGNKTALINVYTFMPVRIFSRYERINIAAKYVITGIITEYSGGALSLKAAYIIGICNNIIREFTVLYNFIFPIACAICLIGTLK